jgi:hypothetical protein
MLTAIHPKLPMRDKAITKAYYEQLGFKDIGQKDYPGYLMMAMDNIEVHFFEFNELNPLENYGQVYIRTDAIEELYQNFLDAGIGIHPNDPLRIKQWNQKEFSLLDPDNNLLTFGQSEN